MVHDKWERLPEKFFKNSHSTHIIHTFIVDNRDTLRKVEIMKTKKEMKISKASIVFYVAAVIFLAIAAFEIYQTYLTVENYKTTYTLQLTDILNLYFTGCVPYFGFAFLAYGIGEVLKKISDLTSTLRLCMEDVIEEAVEEDAEEFVTEPVASEMKNA